jgi:general stress protein YciG
MTKKRETGFALMKVERQRQIASMGGKACPAEKRTFSNREKAIEAGKKGGFARAAKLWAAKKHLLEKRDV